MNAHAELLLYWLALKGGDRKISPQTILFWIGGLERLSNSDVLVQAIRKLFILNGELNLFSTSFSCKTFIDYLDINIISIN